MQSIGEQGMKMLGKTGWWDKIQAYAAYPIPLLGGVNLKKAYGKHKEKDYDPQPKWVREHVPTPGFLGGAALGAYYLYSQTIGKPKEGEPVPQAQAMLQGASGICSLALLGLAVFGTGAAVKQFAGPEGYIDWQAGTKPENYLIGKEEREALIDLSENHSLRFNDGSDRKITIDKKVDQACDKSKKEYFTLEIDNVPEQYYVIFGEENVSDKVKEQLVAANPSDLPLKKDNIICINDSKAFRALENETDPKKSDRYRDLYRRIEQHFAALSKKETGIELPQDEAFRVNSYFNKPIGEFRPVYFGLAGTGKSEIARAQIGSYLKANPKCDVLDITVSDLQEEIAEQVAERQAIASASGQEGAIDLTHDSVLCARIRQWKEMSTQYRKEGKRLIIFIDEFDRLLRPIGSSRDDNRLSEPVAGALQELLDPEHQVDIAMTTNCNLLEVLRRRGSIGTAGLLSRLEGHWIKLSDPTPKTQGRIIAAKLFALAKKLGRSDVLDLFDNKDRIKVEQGIKKYQDRAVDEVKDSAGYKKLSANEKKQKLEEVKDREIALGKFIKERFTNNTRLYRQLSGRNLHIASSEKLTTVPSRELFQAGEPTNNRVSLNDLEKVLLQQTENTGGARELVFNQGMQGPRFTKGEDGHLVLDESSLDENDPYKAEQDAITAATGSLKQLIDDHGPIAFSQALNDDPALRELFPLLLDPKISGPIESQTWRSIVARTVAARAQGNLPRKNDEAAEPQNANSA